MKNNSNRYAYVMGISSTLALCSGSAWGQDFQGGAFARAGKPEIASTQSDPEQARKRWKELSLGFAPLTSFSLAGSLGAGGGTQSTIGSLLSLSYQSRFSKQGTSVGWSAYTYFPYEKSDSDAKLYGLSGNYLFNERFGIQVGYQNLYIGSAPSLAIHGLINIGSGQFGGKPAPVATSSKDWIAGSAPVAPSKVGRNWSVDMGLGAYINFAPDLVPRVVGGNTILEKKNRSSVGFSSYVAASIGLTDDVSLTLTQWIFRDRNVDIGRFSIGVSYKF